MAVRSDNLRNNSVFVAAFPAIVVLLTRDLFCVAMLLVDAMRLDPNCGKRDFGLTEATAAIRLDEATVGLITGSLVTEVVTGRHGLALTFATPVGFTKPVSNFGFTVLFMLELELGCATICPLRCAR